LYQAQAWSQIKKCLLLRDESRSDGSNEAILKCYRFFLENIVKHLAKQYQIDLQSGRINSDKIASILLHNAPSCQRFLTRLFDAITNRFYILEATVPGQDVMYEMYETLNQRGEKLLVGDLFKNLIFERFGEGIGEERIETLWAELDDIIGDSMEDFLRHFWLSNFRFVRSGKLFRAIRDKIGEFNDPAEFERFMRRMIDESRIYSALKNPKDVRWTTGETVQLISELKYLNFKQGLPLLLAVCKKYGSIEPQKFFSLLKAYLNLVVRAYTILEGNPNEFEEEYSEWARDLRNDARSFEAIINDIKSYTPNNNDVRLGIIGKNRVSPQVGRYLITKINDALANPLARAWANNPTVEHIIPKTPSGWWAEYLRVKNLNHKSLVERLGNLTILSQGENSELGNIPYAEKLVKYRGTNLPINSVSFSGANFDEFTDSSIQKREEIFADLIEQQNLWA
jgi:hypothetical protein